MVTKKQLTLNQLRRAIAMEKERKRKAMERIRLQMELKQLRSSGRSDVARRIGRGFVILSKKVGSVAMKQAKLIRERQLREEKTMKKRKKSNLVGMDDMFGPPGF